MDTLHEARNTYVFTASRTDAGALFALLGSSKEGLTQAAVEQIQRDIGPNQVQLHAPFVWWRQLWECYRNPFNLLLTLLAFVSLITDDLKSTVVIAAMVVLSTGLRFWQERKSQLSIDALKAMVSNTATVIRKGGDPSATHHLDAHLQEVIGEARATRVEVPISSIVPGDLVLLSAGDMVPADCRVVTTKDLFVSQAALTGESMPIEKHAGMSHSQDSDPLALENIVYMGTSVVSGAATALVIGTGRRTFFGRVAGRLGGHPLALDSFELGVNKVSWLLLRFMSVMIPLVFLINGYTKGDWLQALLFALSVAVGLTPEMLPMIVTATLAKGAVFLSRRKVIVKRLNAIQSFGAMDVLCTDKTGTLTQDKVCLAHHVDAWGRECAEVLTLAYLNSYYQTGLKSLLDVAVLEHADQHHAMAPTQNYRKIDEIPFDFNRRRMSVVVGESNERHMIVTKGAVEAVLAVCSSVQRDGIAEPLDSELMMRISSVTEALNQQGLRVVAVAVRELATGQPLYQVTDECNLTLVGYVAFLDPPKDSAAAALKALADHGVHVKVLTGDNELVTAKVCRAVGLAPKGVMLGSAIEVMSDQELKQAVESNTIFARLTPIHKERIVNALKQNGHVVGCLGDGINDAPALRAADIGISVDTGVDIAREAADIVLLEKSLLVLDDGVIEGRRTFLYMLKYIKLAVSANFGNVFSVLIASVVIPFLPMLPIHLLVQNLLSDISQIAIPFDHVDDNLLQQPQQWHPDEIGRFMLFFGPVSSVFDLLTFTLMWFVFGANTVHEQSLFQSGWFVVGVLTQVVIIHLIRTPVMPFLQSRASVPVLVMTTIMIAVAIFLPMGPWAHYFKLTPLPGSYFLFLPLIMVGYMMLMQGVKRAYLRRYPWQ